MSVPLGLYHRDGEEGGLALALPGGDSRLAWSDARVGSTRATGRKCGPLTPTCALAKVNCKVM